MTEKIKIIIADDNKNFSENLKQFLESNEDMAVVSMTNNGIDVLKMVEELEPDILILDEPTRGIDVGAKYEIYTIMHDLIAQGKSIIMISSEMPELLGMADRVMVMCEGRVSGFLDRERFDQVEVMRLATQFAS